MSISLIREASDLLKNAKHTIVFTGAGISVESGIPPFRGEGGLWSEYDPGILDLDLYLSRPQTSWPVIKKLFFDFFGVAKPNAAHKTLAELESNGIVKEVITQNIDSLHQIAGSKVVWEYHGNCRQFICTECNRVYQRSNMHLTDFVPLCKHCSGHLKPDFVFFGEGIPLEVQEQAESAASKCDVVLIIGTAGEVFPACYLPFAAKNNGAKVVEVNTHESSFTNETTDVFLQGKAGEVLPELGSNILSKELPLI